MCTILTPGSKMVHRAIQAADAAVVVVQSGLRWARGAGCFRLIFRFARAGSTGVSLKKAGQTRHGL